MEYFFFHQCMSTLHLYTHCLSCELLQTQQEVPTMNICNNGFKSCKVTSLQIRQDSNPNETNQTITVLFILVCVLECTKDNAAHHSFWTSRCDWFVAVPKQWRISTKIRRVTFQNSKGPFLSFFHYNFHLHLSSLSSNSYTFIYSYIIYHSQLYYHTGSDINFVMLVFGSATHSITLGSYSIWILLVYSHKTVPKCNM